MQQAGDRIEKTVQIGAITPAPSGLRADEPDAPAPCCGNCGSPAKLRWSQNGFAACGDACERALWSAARQRDKAAERMAEFDAAVGANFARAFDAAKFPGKAEAIAQVRAWRPSLDRPNLVLNGVTDKGKTRLAVMALRESYERTGVMPVIVWPGELSIKVASAWSDIAAQGLRDRLAKASVLLLDDIDKDKFTERTAEMLFAVIDERLRHGRPTIVTVNASEEAFAAKFPNPETARATLRRIIKHGVTVTP